jgi:hypothetical protein
MTSPALSQKYRAEIERLDEEYRDLERMWSQVPWFALFALLSPVVGAVWGWGAGVVELMVTGALVGTQAYLVAVRQTENRWNRTKLDHDLSEQQAAPGRDVSATRRLASVERPLRRAQPAA